MRLYRFIDEDKNIDAVVVTDGSCDQKRVFITEIRGIISPGGDDECVLTIKTSIPSKKEVEIHFPNTVTLTQEAGASA